MLYSVLLLTLLITMVVTCDETLVALGSLLASAALVMLVINFSKMQYYQQMVAAGVAQELYEWVRARYFDDEAEEQRQLPTQEHEQQQQEPLESQGGGGAE